MKKFLILVNLVGLLNFTLLACPSKKKEIEEEFKPNQTATIARFFLYMSAIDTSYIHLWKGALHWLSEIKKEAGDGYWWPYEQGTDKYLPGMVAGIGTAYLEAYLATDSVTYYDLAQGAIRWLISEAEEETTGCYKWRRVSDEDLYTPVHDYGILDIGDFFLKAYDLTHDTTVARYLKGIANWLKYKAVKDSIGYKWHWFADSGAFQSGWCRGAAGIGEFFYHMHERFGDTLVDTSWYIDYADSALYWVVSVAEEESTNCYRWPYYRKRNEIEYHPSWGKGPAGIGLVFLKAYEKTGDSLYLKYAIGCGNWLKAKAIPSHGGYKWEKYVGSGEYLIPLCQGMSGISLFFIDLWKKTNEPQDTSYGIGLCRYLDSIKVSDRGSYTWRLHEDDSPSDSLPVWVSPYLGWMFLEMAKSISNPMFITNATYIARWLDSCKVEEYGGYKWPSTVVPIGTEEDKKPYPPFTLSIECLPNPSTQRVKLIIKVFSSGNITLKIYNIGGEIVKTVLDKHIEPGSYIVYWYGRNLNGQEVGNGIYFCQVQLKNYTETKKILFIKI
jgi:hypothetical protein